MAATQTDSVWSRLTPRVLVTVQKIFGETVTYQPQGGPAFTLQAHFDEAFESVEVQAEVPISTLRPVLDVILSDFATVPLQGDRVTIGTGAAARTFEVVDVQVDGDGGALLLLHKA